MTKLLQYKCKKKGLNAPKKYTLKYTLSEKEMKEYTFLHQDGSDYYIQAVFMNDAISEHKNATILSETKMNVEAHKEMCSNLHEFNALKNTYKSKKIDILLSKLNESKQIFDIVAYPQNSNSTSMFQTATLINLPFQRGNSKLIVANGIYYSPVFGGGFEFRDDEIQISTVTFYHSQDTILGNVFTQDLNNTTTDN